MKNNSISTFIKCNSCDNYAESGKIIRVTLVSDNDTYTKDNGNLRLCPKCYEQFKRFIAEREPECDER